MQISWKGQACFSLVVQQAKEQVKLVIDPFAPSFTGLHLPRLEADIVLATHGHQDHNNIEGVKSASPSNKGEPFAITGPGEYEIKGVAVQGITSFHDEKQGSERGQNTLYVIEAEGMRLCHLGDIGQAELTSEQISQIGNVDILFVPVGGVYTVEAKAAATIVHQIEPRLVVPMHYWLPGLKFKLEKVDGFLKEMGVKNAEPQSKLSVKLRDLPQEETKVVVLTP